MNTTNFMLIGGIMLLAFAILNYISFKVRFSSLLVFIVSGTILRQYFSDITLLHQVAEIGIVLLFFILGLEFPLEKMIKISKKSWPAGLLDIFLNIGIGFLISYIFGLDIFTSFFIGAIVYASSSSITIKLLEEKKRLANRETDFILALLIFEDLASPILVSFFVAYFQGDQFNLYFAAGLLLKIILLTLGAVLIAYYGFRKMGKFIEKYIEKDFMAIFVMGIALSYAGLAIYLGLSEVLGAFLAGIMLSETGKGYKLEKLVLSIRNITLPFFFFWFGTSVYLGEGISWPTLLIVLIIWSIAAKLMVAFWGGQFFGLSKRTALRGGFSLVQRGEFSVIIAAMAPASMRTYAGIYILIIAVIGIVLFKRAAVLANYFIRD